MSIIQALVWPLLAVSSKAKASAWASSLSRTGEVQMPLER